MTHYQLRCQINAADRLSVAEVSAELGIAITRPEGNTDAVTLEIRHISGQVDRLLQEVALTGSQMNLRVILGQNMRARGEVLVVIKETGEAVSQRLFNPQSQGPNAVYGIKNHAPAHVVENTRARRPQRRQRPPEPPPGEDGPGPPPRVGWRERRRRDQQRRIEEEAHEDQGFYGPADPPAAGDPSALTPRRRGGESGVDSNHPSNTDRPRTGTGRRDRRGERRTGDTPDDRDHRDDSMGRSTFDDDQERGTSERDRDLGDDSFGSTAPPRSNRRPRRPNPRRPASPSEGGATRGRSWWERIRPSRTPRRPRNRRRPRPRVKPLDVIRGVWGFAKPMITFGVFGGVVGCPVFTKEFLYPRYKQGVEDAKQVAEIVHTMPMIPIYTRNGPDGEELLTHLSAKPFVEYEGVYIDPDGERYTSDWTPKPIPVKAVQPGGRLELTRQALVVAEDVYAEWNIGWNPTAPYHIIRSGFRKGGSGVHDQLCGSVWDRRADIKNQVSTGIFSVARFERKSDEVFCGIGLGLGRQMTIDETFAGYFTFVQLGRGAAGVMNFLDRYYDIKDLNDPRLKRAHFVVLAALPKRTYSPTSGENSECYTEALCWNAIKGRVTDYVLPRMVEKGLLTQTEVNEIVKELESPDLVPKGFYDQTLYHARADHAYLGQVRALAEKELLDRCGRGAEKKEERTANCHPWRRKIGGAYAAIHPELQQAVVDASTWVIQEMPPGNRKKVPPEIRDAARATAFVVNDEGEYIAVHTGGQEGWDRLALKWANRRLTEPEFPGSTGKLAIGVALTAKGLSPASEEAAQVRDHLRRSSEKLEDSSKDLGASDDVIRQAIDCYGEWSPSEFTYNERAVVGIWQLPPVNYAGFMYAMLTGDHLVTPHVVTGDYLRTGGERPYTFNNVAEAPHCPSLIFQNGQSRLWGSVPLEGTMRGLKPLPSGVRSIIGKTGTANADLDGDGNSEEKTTNVMWAPFAVEFNGGERYMVVTRIRPERINNGQGTQHDKQMDMGANLTSTDVAVPLSKRILRALGDL